MNDILSNISNVGFPILVAIYSLVRLEKTIQEHTQVLTKLYERICRSEDNYHDD